MQQLREMIFLKEIELRQLNSWRLSKQSYQHKISSIEQVLPETLLYSSIWAILLFVQCSCYFFVS